MDRMRWGAVLCLILFLPMVSTAETGSFFKYRSIAFDSSKSMRERITAIHQLGETGGDEAAAALLELLRNPSEEEGIRCSSARELAQLERSRTETIQTLEGVYRETRVSLNLMYTILFCLGKMRAVDSLPLMVQALSDPRPMIRFKASQAMGELKADESSSLLASHLPKETDRMVRAEMVRALGQLPGVTAEKALAKALTSDPEPLVRLNAALFLRTFDTLSPEARLALVEAQKDPSPAVRNIVKGVNQ